MAKTPKTVTAVRVSVTVHKNDIVVGYGWYYQNRYGMTIPELFDFHDNPLEAGWYGLEILPETRLVVMNRTIQ